MTCNRDEPSMLVSAITWITILVVLAWLQWLVGGDAGHPSCEIILGSIQDAARPCR